MNELYFNIIPGLGSHILPLHAGAGSRHMWLTHKIKTKHRDISSSSSSVSMKKEEK
jgi:hypothetical protein